MHSTPSEPRRPANKRDVVKLAREQNVRFVRLVFADIFGVSKNVSIPASELERALEGRITFDGGSIDGFVRGEELDMLLRPGSVDVRALPVARARRCGGALDLRHRDARWFALRGLSAHDAAPRNRKRRAPFPACASLRKSSSIFSNATPATAKARRPATSARTSTSPRTIRARTRATRSLPRSARWGCASKAPITNTARVSTRSISSHEDPLIAADNVLTLRTLAKHVASRFALDATFMPKPLEDRAGSGLHVDFQLGDESEDTTLYVVGGLLAHAPATPPSATPPLTRTNA